MSNASQLALHLCEKIVEYCVAKRLERGARLTERKLALELGVSRSPVRLALKELAQRSVVERSGAGYVLARDGVSLTQLKLDVPPPPANALYLQLLRDRFAGKLDDHVSEADLLRTYGVTRSTLQKSLMKLNRDGYITRSAGRGWSFNETLGSIESYRASYEFRLAIEPAALRSPNYRIDQARLQSLLSQHIELMTSNSGSINGIEWSTLDSELHETLVSLSGNDFFLRAIRDQNRLRGIVEVESFYADDRVRTSIEEHVAILRAVLDGNPQWAAALLTRHLELAAESHAAFHAKVDSTESGTHTS